MPFAIGGNQLDTGYDVSNSIRFDDAGGSFLQRVAGTNTGEDNATLSFWFKLGNIKSANNGGHVFVQGGTSGFSVMQIFANKIYIGSENFAIMFPNLIRDVSAWYHLFVAFDTSQSTNTDRVQAYLNGVLLTNATTFTDYPDQNEDLGLCVNGNTTRIGGRGNAGDESFDGYLAEFHFLDGTTKAHTDFGEFNDNGVWIPKKYNGGSYGNNGFFLEFKQTGTSQNSSGIGADTSGQDQHFAVTNLAAIDVTTDTCTNNFATLNPLDNIQSATFSEGNCKVVTNTSNRNFVTGTFGLTSGKWYWECKLTAVTSNANDQAFFGIADLDDRGVNSTGESLGDRANEVGWHQEQGRFQRNNSFSNGSTAGDSAGWVIGDIVAIALDADNNRVTIAKNGQWADGSGNADESNPTSFVSYNSSTMTPAMGEGGGGTSATWECNFGNSAFSISSGNSDSEGHGNFEFAVPSGYFALCTKNLAEYG